MRKMISDETRYKTHNAKLLAIIEAFQNWRYYLEGYQYKVLVLIDHNNLCWFMDIKNYSSRQVCQAQELFCYHFRINYCQGKANGAADALSNYPQWSQSKKEILQAENTRVFRCLQSLLPNARLSSTPLAHVASLKHVIICGMHTFSNLYQSWETFRQELAAGGLYQPSIRGMRLRLVELQAEDGQVQKIRMKKLSRN